MINKVEFTSRNLTPYGGLLPLFNYTEKEGIFQEIFDIVVFDSMYTEKIKMNHIKSLMALDFIGADKLSRMELIKNDPLLIKGIEVYPTNPENVSRFLNNFSFKTTQMLREVNFKVFKKLLKKSELRTITIDIDSTVENLEGNQEGAEKGYNPKKHGNKCYNGLMSFCAELKAFITGFQRSGNTYTSNGTAEMIKEIIENLKEHVDNIIFRMDSGYFSEEIISVIEAAGYQYLIKAKHYAKLVSKTYDIKNLVWDEFEDNTQITSSTIKLDAWSKERDFIITRHLKEENKKQEKMFESDKYEHNFYVTNLDVLPEDGVLFYRKRGNCENYIKEAKYDMNVGKMILYSFWANEAIFQLQMLVYNIFLLFKKDNTSENEYREQIKTFRLKYVFVAAKIIKTGRQLIMKCSENYSFKEVFMKATA